ncbi:MAG: chromate transporter [Rhodospirillales bacterium CG15_BIG_FIL_POST_REV_8_21_14_020_66_15]|nr:MAG: chromate transporter [Rhodospirillales bacterium CG15_BIG_FIL_POST_REV_8_21_14_020_66_15]
MNDTGKLEGGSDPQGRQSVAAVFLTFLQLGFTSFGGPVAHLGYFREAFVVRRRWIDEKAYADLVALCQFLPGPASSQVGIGIGLAKAGLPGALAAWVAFTMPSAFALILFGYGVVAFQDVMPAGLLHGLKVVAVAVVAQAVWGMARSLTPDAPRITMAVLAAAAVLAVPTPLMQVAVIAAGGVTGLMWLRAETDSRHVALGVKLSRGLAAACLIVFFALLVGLPILVEAHPSQTMAMIDGFFRSGSLVFGGGHVVLPLLQSEVVPPGWVTNDAFLAGYGAAQAVPGPLFTFAAYLGVVFGPVPNGWAGGLICLVAIFAPSFLLVIGTLPFWDVLRRDRRVQKALLGVNAAVVGLLLAALYRPVWTSGILAPMDFALALGAFTLLVFWKLPPWLVVVMSAFGGWGVQIFTGT